MLLIDVVEVSAAVAATGSRNAKAETVAGALRRASPAEAPLVAAYLSGVLPQRRISVGWRSLRELPDAATAPSVTLTEVDRELTAIGSVHGAGSAAQRGRLVHALLSRCTGAEQRFLVRLITGELRQGAMDGVMLRSISLASGAAESAVRRAVMLAGYAAPVAAAAMGGGQEALAAIGLQVGRPVRPMLAAPAATVPEAMDGRGGAPVAVECKVDGIRIQAHKTGGRVRLFTRSLDEVTDRLPEVVQIVRSLEPQTLVLDGEAVALAPDGRPEPFQVTGARTASSQDPQRLRETTPVTPMFFDLLHLDGTDLLDRPARARVELLARVVPDRWRVPRAVVATSEEAQAQFDRWVAAGHEGVVVKRLDAVYAAGRRGAGWVKVKPRHTLDLVVLAVEWGSGRRHGKLSNIHLGARDPRTGQLQMLGKTFKGMTDELLDWQTRRFTELATERAGHVVYVRPEQVVEIAFDGVQRSTRYPSGMALRFARVVRYRDDKTAEDADTLDAVRAVAGF